MGSAAGLNVCLLDVDDSQVVSRHNTSLVESEAVLFLRLGLVHEALVDLFSAENNSIRLIFDVDFLLLSERLIVSDI